MSLLKQGQGKLQKKILFISTLTPPNYGASLSSEMCLKILKDDSRFKVENIKLNYSAEMSDVGKVNFNKIYGLFQVRYQIRRSLKQFEPDLIYFVPAVAKFGLVRDYLFLRIIKILKKGKLILHVRAQFKEEDWDNPIKNYIIRHLLECDKVIVLGQELVENLNNTVLFENIRILPNAIPKTLSDTEFRKILEQRTLNSNLHLLFLSNMHEAKGWFKVLETCKLLKESEIEFTCHFVGEWTSKSDTQKFYDYVENNNLLRNIVFHGQLLDKEKNNMLAIADILIFPTEWDACPRVIIEAMEFGLNIIANNEGTIPSLVKHGETGYILQRNVAVEIFEYILILLDSSIRNTMGIKGRQRFLENFTLNTYKNRFIEILNEE